MVIAQDSSWKGNERLIDGLFYSVWSDEVAQFTGVFNHSTGRDSIEGILQDSYGNSRIEGLFFEDKTLSFDKTYWERPPIAYKFSFDKEKGLYLGAWSGKDAFRGYAACKLDERLTQPNVDTILNYFRSFDPLTDEQKAKIIIDYMVEEGNLNVSRDPNTGEVMIGLTSKGEELARNVGETLTLREKRSIDERLDESDDGIPF